MKRHLPFALRLTACLCAAAFALVFLSGCMSVQNGKMSTSDKEIGINPDNGKYCVEVDVLTQTSDPSKKPSIDTSRSFAVSPSGKRFKLRVGKNEYIEENIKSDPTPRIYADLFLIDPSQQPGNGDDIKWKNGNWKLDLFFKGPTSQPPIHSEFRIYTTWYWFFMPLN
jgi:hypothetical protein